MTLFNRFTARDIAMLYAVWGAMLSRCYSGGNKQYKDYGGRGITVCEEWADADTFVMWALESGYVNGLSLDRINNDAGYEPENCKWSTRQEQVDNRRNTIRITAFGETKLVREWLVDSRCNVEKAGTLFWRLREGWDHEDALTVVPGGPRIV